MVDVEKKDNITIIRVSGRLEINQALELEETINSRINQGEKFFIFDLGDVHYLSSSGIRVFIATMRQLKENNGRMILANLTPNVHKTLKIVELDGLFEIMGNVEDAVKVLKS
ncbi:STAS domain-containing protein [Thermospira aquatica]|uniref:Anti-sigma factor antagonist n=1 Tax=Thermospira aquatica TaxID=2828656 RepID=A0AAX3BAW1_9SPIR|nr:STAS domain-containing protein [Thermospira aquatica]URA09129.1 STAS domain-containing protein [Thermospira aquatica]